MKSQRTSGPRYVTFFKNSKGVSACFNFWTSSFDRRSVNDTWYKKAAHGFHNKRDVMGLVRYSKALSYRRMPLKRYRLFKSWIRKSIRSSVQQMICQERRITEAHLCRTNDDWFNGKGYFGKTAECSDSSMTWIAPLTFNQTHLI